MSWKCLDIDVADREFQFTDGVITPIGISRMFEVSIEVPGSAGDEN